MFISVLELFKIGIGPSSSHTMGPMVAARRFVQQVQRHQLGGDATPDVGIRCILKGSLAYTGKGHATDRAITLGLHGHTPEGVAEHDVDALVRDIWQRDALALDGDRQVGFSPDRDIIFDRGQPLPEHPNGMIFELVTPAGEILLTETVFSIGGGFIASAEEIGQLAAPLKSSEGGQCPFGFATARAMLEMAEATGLSIAAMKRANEMECRAVEALDAKLDAVWGAMHSCVENGLSAEGILPGGLDIPRRARHLFDELRAHPEGVTVNDWLCAYAMAVNEENAAGHLVVTAPTNGAAGVIPAVLYHLVEHEGGTAEQVRDFLLTAAAIGGIIKHNSSISGAEVGCQGEVGSAAAMAAAGLCAARGGSAPQIEKAAEMALEHHLGMTCDPVKGLVQVPCIERNGFGAIKAYAAASLALRETGQHFMPLDNCIAAMKRTGQEMSAKYKETSLGGLAVSITEC
ncbi:MAG TPA: L-serine ammonia-lyase [Thioalkalivibrio sp.]|nr:L-serine ammonia-lyase [Thioalkalivibrio sp.]